MPLTGGDIAVREGDRVEVRAQPVRMHWTLADLATSDGHRLTCTFGCSVAAVDRAADRQMLAETFLATRDVVDVRDVAQHFHRSLTAAAAKLALDKPGEEWLNDGSERAMEQALRDAAKPVAFACGIELLPPFEVQLTSPTVAQARLEAMERQLAEQRSAGQAEHFQRAAELLQRFDAMRAASPGLSVGRVIEAVSAADRGTMLQTLLAASTSEAPGAAELWAVGGMGLMRIGRSGSEVDLQTYDLPTDVGPPRSLRPAELDGEAVWLIGCRSGVLIIRRADRSVRTTLRDEGVPSSLGFSRAVLQRDELIACHSEAGIALWRMDRPESPVTTLRPMADEQPRNLCQLDAARVVYSGGRGLVVLEHGARLVLPPDSPHDVCTLLVHGRELFVVHSDGEVVIKDRATLGTISRSRHCGPVSAAALLPWVGGVRLLLATQDGPICCVGLEDSVVTQYVSRHRGIKGLAASDGLVAAISGDRQRVILWNSWDGRAPVSEVSIAVRTRHRVADITFAPADVTAAAKTASSASSASQYRA